MSVRPFLPFGNCLHTFAPFIITDQCHTRYCDVAAHKYNEKPDDHLTCLDRKHLDKLLRLRQKCLKPHNRRKSPEKSVQQIDPAPKIERDLAVIPEYLSEYKLCKYTAEIFIRTA